MLELIEQVRDSVRDDNYWKSKLDQVTNLNNSQYGIHLAIFVEPYLKFILDGKKTVESRFSSNRIAPYQRVHEGDIILLKRSSGPIMGLCEISKSWFYNLDPKSWKDIKEEFTIALCAQDPEFWVKRKNASYATLMKFKHTKAIDPINWTKPNRRGWIILHNRRHSISNNS